MQSNQQGNAAVQIVWVITAIILVVAAFMIVRNTNPGAPITFATPYQAVMLTNNNFYVGKMEGYGTSRPVLTDVFVIVTQTNPDTKQTSKALVRLSKIELSASDRMYLNPSQILAIEPVDPKSQIAQTIAQQSGH